MDPYTVSFIKDLNSRFERKASIVSPSRTKEIKHNCPENVKPSMALPLHSVAIFYGAKPFKSTVLEDLEKIYRSTQQRKPKKAIANIPEQQSL